MRRAGWLLGLSLLAGCSKGAELGPEANATANPEPRVSVPAEPSIPAAPQIPSKSAPADECSKLPGSDTFRAAIKSAVAKRDAAAFIALAAPDIVLDFGGGAGRDELQRRLSDLTGAELWAELSEIQALGCAAREDGLTIPWMAAQDYGDDTFEVMLVTGAEVPLLASAKGDAEVLRRLSWAMVKPLSGFDYAKPYRKVHASDGSTGYVASKYLRSPIDYRLAAERRAEGWQITAFVAGD